MDDTSGLSDSDLSLTDSKVEKARVSKKRQRLERVAKPSLRESVLNDTNSQGIAQRDGMHEDPPLNPLADFWKSAVEGSRFTSAAHGTPTKRKRSRGSPGAASRFSRSGGTTGSPSVRQCTLTQMTLSATQQESMNASKYDDGHDTHEGRDHHASDDVSVHTPDSGTDGWIAEMGPAHMLQDAIHDSLCNSTRELSQDDRMFLKAWGAKIETEQSTYNQEVWDAMQTRDEEKALSQQSRAMNSTLRKTKSQVDRARTMVHEREDKSQALHQQTVRDASIHRLLGGIDALRSKSIGGDVKRRSHADYK